MHSDAETCERLWAVLEQDAFDQTVYGYRVDQAGQVTESYLFRWYCHFGLLESIRDKFGPGDYRLLIRKGRVMVFSGYISIGPVPTPHVTPQISCR